MRAYAVLALAALVLASVDCAGARHAAADSRTVFPPRLHPCETRELTVDGADIVVASNADASLASVRVVKAPNAIARREALHDVHGALGPVQRDASVVAHQSKWGLTTWTDRCGNPVLTHS
jgi:hypothetical protein